MWLFYVCALINLSRYFFLLSSFLTLHSQYSLSLSVSCEFGTVFEIIFIKRRVC